MMACSSAGDMLMNLVKEKQSLPWSAKTKHIHHLAKINYTLKQL